MWGASTIAVHRIGFGDIEMKQLYLLMDNGMKMRIQCQMNARIRSSCGIAAFPASEFTMFVRLIGLKARRHGTLAVDRPHEDTPPIID